MDYNNYDGNQPRNPSMNSSYDMYGNANLDSNTDLSGKTRTKMGSIQDLAGRSNHEMYNGNPGEAAKYRTLRNVEASQRINGPPDMMRMSIESRSGETSGRMKQSTPHDPERSGRLTNESYTEKPPFDGKPATMINTKHKKSAKTMTSTANYERQENVLNAKGIFAQAFTTIKKLDLSGCNLNKINMCPFVNLEVLSLKNNQIDSPAWLESNIGKLGKLKALDVRYNKLEAMQMLCDTISMIPTLEAFFLEGNPCYVEETQENRFIFLAKNRYVLDAQWGLKYLNGKPIIIDERIECVKCSVNPPGLEFAEDRRLKLVMSKNNLSSDAAELNLSQYGFRLIMHFDQFQNLTKLNLSKNRLTSINNSKLELIENLQTLNLSQNMFDNLSDLIKELKRCHKLRHLALVGNTLPKNYQEVVLNQLSAIEHLDDRQNAGRLSDIQIKAASYLLKLSGNNRHRVGANNCINMDLSALNVDKKHFVKVVKALSILPVETVMMHNNEWTTLLNYRLLVIYYAKTLKELDGERIISEDRANAIRIFDEFEKKIATSKMSGDKRFDGSKVLEQVVRSGNKDKGESIYVGTILSKFEIAITYFQVQGLLLSLIGSTLLPDGFLKSLATLVKLISFLGDIDYIRLQHVILPICSLIGPILFLIYYAKVEETSFSTIFIYNWKASLFLVITVWVLAILSFVLFLFGTTAQENYAANVGFGFAIFCVTLLVIFFILIGISVRKHHKSEKFWYSLIRVKRRITLFLLTTIYMPLNQAVLKYFRKCEEGVNQICTIPTGSDIPGIWGFLIPLSIILISVLPVFFTRLIAKGVKQVMINYGIHQELNKIQEKKYKLHEMKERNQDITLEKQELKVMRQKLNTKYAVCMETHESASSYLFASYKINFHYWKIFLMMERLLLCILNIFIQDENQNARIIAGLVITALVMVACIGTRPFSDPVEDLLEIVSHIFNGLLIFLGLLLGNGSIQKDLFGTIHLMLVIMFAISFISAAASTPLRKRIFTKRTESQNASSAQELGTAKTRGSDYKNEQSLRVHPVESGMIMRPAPVSPISPTSPSVADTSTDFASTNDSNLDELYKEYSNLDTTQEHAFDA